MALRDEDAGAASTVGPLATRTEDHLLPSQEEQCKVEAECSEDAAGAEVMLAAAGLLAGWTTKQGDEWKDCNPRVDIKAGKLRVRVRKRESNCREDVRLVVGCLSASAVVLF